MFMHEFKLLMPAIAIILVAFIYLIFTKNDNLRRAAPSLLTTLGIFFTFLGVSWGLYNFKTNDNDLVDSVNSLLQGLKFAFIPSSLGVLLSLIAKYKELNSKFFGWSESDPSLEALNKIVNLLDRKKVYTNNFANLSLKELVMDFGSFIIHNGNKYVILFSYAKNKIPTVIAKTKDEQAKQMLNLAKKIDLPLIEDKFLATELYVYTNYTHVPKHILRQLAQVIGKNFKKIKSFVRNQNNTSKALAKEDLDNSLELLDTEDVE